MGIGRVDGLSVVAGVLRVLAMESMGSGCC